MADRLAALFTHFAVTPRTFHSGPLCGINSLGTEEGLGQLHVVREGQIDVFHGASAPVRITVPTLLLYPRPVPRRFVTDATVGADMVCADLRFEGGAVNPVQAALPDHVFIPLERLADSQPVLALLFAEASSDKCGRQTLLDSLFEVLLVQVLRELMEQGQIGSGMLAGMAHQKLRKAITALHDQPAHPWSLEELAEQAGMSRTAFASRFKEVVGVTPGQYLQSWRLGLAQKRVYQGMPMHLVAEEVGYADDAALSRAFKAHTGLSPRDWRKRQAHWTGRS
ncbi:AraC family transcriptional regulator [Leptospira sp. 96542]|nr:AraC family transcriptional regulator [Leptospira sp. 96542]